MQARRLPEQTSGSRLLRLTANGMLAGLVAITAPSGFVAPWAALLIGAIAGVLVVESVIFIERVLKIDDPVGAISVHGTCGLWGVISLGLLADGTYGAGLNGVDGTVRGLFYGDPKQLVAQLIGAATILIWAGGLGWIFFKVQDAIQGIRSKPDDEEVGLDLPEMGRYAYPDLEAPGATLGIPGVVAPAGARAQGTGAAAATGLAPEGA
jgi:Amt family ammonium transporter